MNLKIELVFLALSLLNVNCQNNEEKNAPKNVRFVVECEVPEDGRASKLINVEVQSGDQIVKSTGMEDSLSSSSQTQPSRLSAQDLLKNLTARLPTLPVRLPASGARSAKPGDSATAETNNSPQIPTLASILSNLQNVGQPKSAEPGNLDLTNPSHLSAVISALQSVPDLVKNSGGSTARASEATSEAAPTSSGLPTFSLPDVLKNLQSRRSQQSSNAPDLPSSDSEPQAARSADSGTTNSSPDLSSILASLRNLPTLIKPQSSTDSEPQASRSADSGTANSSPDLSSILASLRNLPTLIKPQSTDSEPQASRSADSGTANSSPDLPSILASLRNLPTLIKPQSTDSEPQASRSVDSGTAKTSPDLSSILESLRNLPKPQSSPDSEPQTSRSSQSQSGDSGTTRTSPDLPSILASLRNLPTTLIKPQSTSDSEPQASSAPRAVPDLSSILTTLRSVPTSIVKPQSDSVGASSAQSTPVNLSSIIARLREQSQSRAADSDTQASSDVLRNLPTLNLPNITSSNTPNLTSIVSRLRSSASRSTDSQPSASSPSVSLDNLRERINSRLADSRASASNIQLPSMPTTSVLGRSRVFDPIPQSSSVLAPGDLMRQVKSALPAFDSRVPSLGGYDSSLRSAGGDPRAAMDRTVSALAKNANSIAGDLSAVIGTTLSTIKNSLGGAIIPPIKIPIKEPEKGFSDSIPQGSNYRSSGAVDAGGQCDICNCLMKHLPNNFNDGKFTVEYGDEPSESNTATMMIKPPTNFIQDDSTRKIIQFIDKMEEMDVYLAERTTRLIKRLTTIYEDFNWNV